MKRHIIQFATCLNHGKSNEARPVVSAYACRNGLAVGHAVKQDSDGDFRYTQGWEIYHVATGALVSTGNIFGDPIKHPTPAAAMRALKNKFKGTLMGKLRARKDDPPVSLKGLPEIIGKLKAWPKPAGKQPPGCERIAAQGYNALRALIAEIDAAISTATRTSGKHRTFTWGRTRFTVGAQLESLQRLRVQVIKNRTAFADSAQPKPVAPVVQVAQAAPEVVAVIIAAEPVPRVKKAVAQAQPPQVLLIDLPPSRYPGRAAAKTIRTRRSRAHDAYFEKNRPSQARIAARGTDEFMLRNIARIKKTSAEWIVHFA